MKRLLYRRARRVVVNSPGFLPFLAGYGVPPAKIRDDPERGGRRAVRSRRARRGAARSMESGRSLRRPVRRRARACERARRRPRYGGRSARHARAVRPGRGREGADRPGDCGRSSWSPERALRSRAAEARDARRAGCSGRLRGDAAGHSALSHHVSEQGLRLHGGRPARAARDRRRHSRGGRAGGRWHFRRSRATRSARGGPCVA